MIELDEIVLVVRLAYALRDCPSLDDEKTRHTCYSRAGIDLRDYIPGLRERLDRKAVQSETARRSVVQTRHP